MRVLVSEVRTLQYDRVLDDAAYILARKLVGTPCVKSTNRYADTSDKTAGLWPLHACAPLRAGYSFSSIRLRPALSGRCFAPPPRRCFERVKTPVLTLHAALAVVCMPVPFNSTAPMLHYRWLIFLRQVTPHI